MNNIEKAKEILAERIDIKNLNPNDKLTELGIDSLDLVEVMIQIEEAIGVEFTSEEISDLKTLNDVLKLIENKSK